MYEEAEEGIDPEPSDAYTVNGQTGDFYPCSKPETYTMQAHQGKIYLLRTVNAGMSNALFLSIAGHKLTAIGSDGSYIKPITTPYILLDLILVADQTPKLACYMAARALSYKEPNQFDNTTTTAILTYTSCNSSANSEEEPPPLLPSLPPYNDAESAANFSGQLRSLEPPDDLPQSARGVGGGHRQLLITVSLNKIETRLLASLNNISFRPSLSVDILEAYYNMGSGVFGVYFPDKPLILPCSLHLLACLHATK